MREYDLLIGILACQLRLVSRGALVRYSAAFADRPGYSLLDYLLDTKALAESDQQLLCRIADSIVHAHHGDEKAALKAFGGDEAATEAFANAITHTNQGWGPSEDQTVLAEHLPHGLPVQIAPEAFGRYTKGSEYARGGIGRILLVHDEQIGRDVILKELLPQHATSPTDSTLSRIPVPESPRSPMRQSASMMARFLQEAKVTGQLEHPSIVPVYELGTRRDGQLYYTMKLVRGDTLATAIKNARSADDRLALLRAFLDVCQAMAYAHSKGVIHRDLKPSNIMVGEFGECVVLDWGLAKMLKDQDAHREAMEKTISQLKLGDEQSAALKTRSKDVLGTPLYMAPEQARGEVDAIDAHSDVYSLGVILYEILSGDLPHPWTNSMDTIRRVGSTPPPPLRRAAPQTPPELAAICDKALKFHAKDRYPSARELARDVQRFLEGAVVDAYAYRAADILRRLYRKHRPIILTAAAAALVLLAMGAISYVNIYNAQQAEEEARIIAEREREEAKTQRNVAEEERARAEQAEERTAREKYISDIRLADAYVRDYKFQAAEDTLLATDPRYRNFEWGYLVAQCHQDIATLAGHDGNVFYLAESPNGDTLLSLSGDGSARLWDLDTRTSLYSWRFPAARVLHGAFDHTGARIALCLDDGLVVILDPATGEELLRLAGHTAPVNDCVFTRDSNELLTCGNDRNVIRWNLADGRPARPLPEHRVPVKRVALTDGERKILTETSDDRLRLFDSATGRLVAEVAGHYVEYANSEDIVAAVSGDTGLIYRGSDLKELLRLPHEDRVNRARYYEKHAIILTTCNDGTARVFKFPEGTLLDVRNLNSPVRDYQLSEAGDRLVAVTYAGAGHVWEYPGGREVSHFAGHRGAVQRMILARGGDPIVTASVDATIRIWPRDESLVSARLGSAAGRVNNFAFAPDAGMIATTSDEGRVLVRKVSGESVYEGLFQIVAGSAAVGLSPDGRFLGLAVDEFLPIIVSLPDGAVLARLDGHRGRVNSLQFSADGENVVTTSWDMTVKVWQSVGGELLSTLEGHSESTNFATFSGDGAWIASSSEDNTVRLWNRTSSAEYQRIECEGNANHVAFSSNGALIAAASDDGTIQIWDVTAKTLLKKVAAPSLRPSHVAFDSTSSRVASTHDSGVIRIADVSSGAVLIEVTPPAGTPLQAHFGGAGDTLMVPTRVNGVLGLLAIPASHQEREAVIAFRDSWAARQRPLESSAAQNVTQHRFLPESMLSGLAEQLEGLETAAAQGLAVSEAFLARPHFWRLGLEAGDILLNANGKPLEDFPAYAAAQEANPLPPTGEIVYFDMLRQNIPFRLQCSVLPVTAESVSIRLTRGQASSLLNEAVELVTRGEGELLQLNRNAATRMRRPVSEPDGIPGYWVNYFPGNAGSAMLRAAGLESGSVVTQIGTVPIASLKALRDMLGGALNSVSAGSTAEVSIELEVGAFASRRQTYAVESTP